MNTVYKVVKSNSINQRNAQLAKGYSRIVKYAHGCEYCNKKEHPASDILPIWGLKKLTIIQETLARSGKGANNKFWSRQNTRQQMIHGRVNIILFNQGRPCLSVLSFIVFLG